ncbi:A disintegrin and metalloproteinase with thrombospondin motifs 8 [Ambystoma mexicanum]|uniref:A disintegrin and metalloproteinase with thrombospondin motifs 8 n=1 Tax=Ambystoma mexicanum TaxID=8296 RepID=UPI0037E8863D
MLSTPRAHSLGAVGWSVPVALLLLVAGALAAPGGRLHRSAPGRGLGGAEEQQTVPVRLLGIPGQVLYRLSAFGRVFVLRLAPDASFLAPGLRVEHLGRGRDRSETGGSTGSRGLRECFFSGTVNGRGDSLAAVSLCLGIRGSFLTEGEEYLIQPASPSEEHPPGARAGSSARQGWDTWLLRPETHLKPHLIRRRGGAGTLGAKAAGPGTASAHREATAEEWAEPEPARSRRFVSEARFVETLLVADASMARFYGEQLQNHILTLMSVAARIYKHPSLKNLLRLVVVKVVVVDDEELGPEVSDNGGLTLRNFCSWQQRLNPASDRQPEHYDTAILLTRKDFCGHHSCDTLGVADIGTMCDPSRSCSVIEDDGLQAAFTLAHELGHVLSMPHDDSKTCERLFGGLGNHHMMAPMFLHLNKTMPWSPCSTMYLTDFLDSGHGDCLLDPPASFLDLPAELPGQASLYGLDGQCQQVFGKEFRHCPNTTEEDICSQLWCRVQDEPMCHTKNATLPWADGTTCGDRKLCWEGQCLAEEEVLKEKPAVDGNWGLWGAWGECSRTCGGGVQFSFRDCDDPEPQNGGKYCQGQRAKYQSCNIEECPPNGRSFRQWQCQLYDSYNFTDMDGNLLQWVPKYAGVSPRDRCKLVCRAMGRNEFKVFDSKVVDGTLCGLESLSVCVQGQCVKAGCDHIIGSTMKLDKCGVCGGNSSTCRKISGSLNRSKYGYNDIITIPTGATNIDFKRRSSRGVKRDGNYLALKTMDGNYLLNGNLAISAMEQDILVKDTILKYSGSLTTLERIQSFQPLPEPLTVQLLSMSSEIYPPKVKYTFFIPKDIPFARQKGKEKKAANIIKPRVTSQWFLGDWSECSKSCGSGWQRRIVECRDMEGKTSTDCDKVLKPEDIKPCGDLPCPVWQMGSWSPCSRTCGEGVRTQSALCADYTGQAIQAEKCHASKRPQSITAECMLQEC